MVSKGESKKARLKRFLEERQISVVDETCAAEIASLLHPISPRYLRSLLRDSGVPLAPMVEGVNHASFDELERTLSALSGEYAVRDAAGRRACRQVVITSKDHMKWAVKRLHANGADVSGKQEMVLWMMTWLENPSLFPDWVRLRRKAAAVTLEGSPSVTEFRSIEP